MGFRYDMRNSSSQQKAIVNHRDNEEKIRKEESERIKREENNELGNYKFEDCEFKITKEDNHYYARCEEMSTYDEDLDNLKTVKIPQCYHSHRELKLP
ncbi:hypothetical protein KLF24_15325 (plasmid) [Clostridium perfringens]|uniref:hypothetical protein n=1 Tax=Clostridium perfringens TaxID=1502 RepID=UPI001F301886|nr:hypothetical protein [Clostridium perfringens]UBL03719.1 hypothetical protein KLF24_15325 [Clostridium perfringens]